MGKYTVELLQLKNVLYPFKIRCNLAFALCYMGSLIF